MSDPRGYGIQRLYTADGKTDATLKVEHGDLVLIREGYHPFVSAFGFDSTRGNPMALTIALLDQSKEMMIVDMLDLVRQNHELAVDLIQFAPVEMVAELLAAQAECMPSRMLAQHQL